MLMKTVTEGAAMADALSLQGGAAGMSWLWREGWVIKLLHGDDKQGTSRGFKRSFNLVFCSYCTCQFTAAHSAIRPSLAATPVPSLQQSTPSAILYSQLQPLVATSTVATPASPPAFRPTCPTSKSHAHRSSRSARPPSHHTPPMTLSQSAHSRSNQC